MIQAKIAIYGMNHEVRDATSPTLGLPQGFAAAWIARKVSRVCRLREFVIIGLHGIIPERGAIALVAHHQSAPTACRKTRTSTKAARQAVAHAHKIDQLTHAPKTARAEVHA